MKYLLMSFAGAPPKVRPVGMNDILGMGAYKNKDNAWRYLVNSSRNPPKGHDTYGLYQDNGVNYVLVGALPC